MKIGVLKAYEGSLVALVPSIAAKMAKEGYEFIMEKGAGTNAFFTDGDYEAEGVRVADRETVFREGQLILADTKIPESEFPMISSGTIVVGRFNPLVEKAYCEKLEKAPFTVFSLDTVPRSSIAQSMDILSSLASLSGYMAVLSAANRFPGYFPMMTTAAGTVPPAKVMVVGAGVAGLQAIATARRLGAVVEAFDVRTAVKEEVQSLGARFIEVEGSTEDKGAGGYAVEQSEAYISRQKELIHERASKSDVIITTANIPGRKAPLLIEQATVAAMRPGSVIIDMAAVSGGNCALSKDQQEVDVNGVRIIGNSALFQQLPREASRLYSTNLYHFLKFILKDGIENMPFTHEIVQKTLIGELKAIKVAS
ncbi:MAG: NAD(P) transhydrogenase subunit alpha [Cyclobacteriaceae bacterium]|nr:NAD(P) transhydrogenase subunit alpha [Cyclobacteriaceae bacterium]